jgi:hypothetical protein
LVKILAAARSTSTSFGRMSRKTARCLVADAAEAVIFDKLEDAFIWVDRFHPDCTAVDRACDEELTERMADSRMSSSERATEAFCFPFALGMVRPVASWSANWSIEMAVFLGLIS